MGAEKGFTELLRRQIAGEQGTPAGLNWKGGTPNHWALAAATAYGYGLKGTPQQKKAGRQKALDFFHMQNQVGHMARGKMSEFGTPSHFAWWQAAVAGLWLLADRAEDQEVLAAARTWWIRELTVENLCATPEGHVVMPGARSHVGGVDADQTKQRDVGRKIILNAEGPAAQEPGFPRLHRTLDPDADPAGGAESVAKAPADLPHPLIPCTSCATTPATSPGSTSSTACAPPTGRWADYATGGGEVRHRSFLAEESARRQAAGGSAGAGAPRRQPGSPEDHGARKDSGGEGNGDRGLSPDTPARGAE